MRPAIAPIRAPRFAQSFLRRRRRRHCFHGNVATPTRGRLCARPCHKDSRIDTEAHSSLLRARPPEASGHFQGLQATGQTPRPRFFMPCPELWPPSTGITRLPAVLWASEFRLRPAFAGFGLAEVGRFRHEDGSPVLPQDSCCAHPVTHAPAGPAGVDLARAPIGGSLPLSLAGGDLRN